MKRIAVIICAGALIALAAGCAQAPAEDRFLAHWEKIVSVVNENKADAAKAEAAVRQYVKDHEADMKTLAGLFGKDKDKKIAEDTNFVSRVLAVIDEINALRASNPALFESQGLADALAPLNDLLR